MWIQGNGVAQVQGPPKSGTGCVKPGGCTLVIFAQNDRGGVHISVKCYRETLPEEIGGCLSALAVEGRGRGASEMRLQL